MRRKRIGILRMPRGLYSILGQLASTEDVVLLWPYKGVNTQGTLAVLRDLHDLTWHAWHIRSKWEANLGWLQANCFTLS